VASLVLFVFYVALANSLIGIFTLCCDVTSICGWFVVCIVITLLH
jgi:hypothetical protein